MEAPQWVGSWSATPPADGWVPRILIRITNLFGAALLLLDDHQLALCKWPETISGLYVVQPEGDVRRFCSLPIRESIGELKSQVPFEMTCLRQIPLYMLWCSRVCVLVSVLQDKKPKEQEKRADFLPRPFSKKLDKNLPAHKPPPASLTSPMPSSKALPKDRKASKSSFPDKGGQ